MHHDEASAFGGEDNTFRIWWVERQRERSGMQLGRVVEVDRIRDPTQLYPATARALDERLGGLQFGGFYGGQPSEARGQVGGGRRDRIPTRIFGSIWRRCRQEGSSAIGNGLEGERCLLPNLAGRNRWWFELTASPLFDMVLAEPPRLGAIVMLLQLPACHPNTNTAHCHWHRVSDVDSRIE